MIPNPKCCGCGLVSTGIQRVDNPHHRDCTAYTYSTSVGVGRITSYRITVIE